MRLIDADALLDELENDKPLNFTDSDFEIQEQWDWEKFKGMVIAAPTIDAVPVVHGKWICKNKAYGEYECSACGTGDSDCSDYYGSHDVRSQDYCPVCGAKMDLEDKPCGE